MIDELEKIVSKYRDKGVDIPNEDVRMILELCKRKMEICKIENKGYLCLLLDNEIKNYLIRRSINTKSYLMKLEESKMCI